MRSPDQARTRAPDPARRTTRDSTLRPPAPGRPRQQRMVLSLLEYWA